MALKAILSKEEHDALPEALREYYVEKDGKFVLDAEGVEDVSGLKNALTAVRDELKTAKKQLQETIDKFKDIDPDKAKEAQKKLQELEDKQLLDAGKVEDLLKLRTERMKADYENQIVAFNKTILDLKKDLKTANQTMAEVLIDNSIRAAAMKAGVLEHAVEDVVLRGQKTWTLKDKTPTAMKGDQVIYGKDPNKPISIDEWVNGLQQDAPHLFKMSAGAGTPPSSGGTSNAKVVRLSREEAKDPQKYRNAKAQAEKAGLPFEIAD
ncbi:MAG: hypothetical protein LAP85_24285 [Acidobacteriia bacterium]|nr:hypothetical protein [Terriglobia bacterium]